MFVHTSARSNAVRSQMSLHVFVHGESSHLAVEGMLDVVVLATGTNCCPCSAIHIHCKNSGGLYPPKVVGFTCLVLASKIGGHIPQLPLIQPPKMVGITHHSRWYNNNMRICYLHPDFFDKISYQVKDTMKKEC